MATMGKTGAALFSVAVGFAMLLPGTARAADWYVDASAASGGTGTQTHPFQTIGASLAGLSRGDTVWIASGTYDEVVNIPQSLPGSSGTTTIRAMPNANVIIDGTSGSMAAGFILQTAAPDTTFQDFTFQNAIGGGTLGIQFYYADGGKVIDCVSKNIGGGAINFYYSNMGTATGNTLQGNIGGRHTTGMVVENNEVYGASAEGIGIYDNSMNATVAHNVIHDNFSVNLYLDSVSHSLYDGNLIYETMAGNDLEGIEISDEGHYPATDLPAPVNSYNTIINNVIYNHAVGIDFWMSDEWSSQTLQNESGLRYDVIANNTLVNNVGGIRWDASPAHVGTTIQNNIIVDAAGSSPAYLLYAKSAGGISLDHNLWYAPDLAQPYLWLADQTDHAGFMTDSGQGASDVLTDPMLVGPYSAPPATNLALQMGSPAIGKGVSLTTVTTDFLGAARPASGVDIGAFQYGAVVPPDGGGPMIGDGGVSPTGDGGVETGSDGGTHAAGHSSHGCSFGGAPSGAPWGLVLVAWSLVRLRRQRRATAAS